MDSSIKGSMEIIGDTTLLEKYSSYREKRDLIEFEDIKVEPYHPEPSCAPLESVIKKEAEVPKQNDKLMIPVSASGEQRTSIKIESDQLGLWEDEPIDFDSKDTSSAVPRKSDDQQEIQNEMGKMCETYVDLPDHSMLRTEEKLHKCNVCRKTFAWKTYLKTHMRIHTEEKPHKCNICGKAFIQKTNMKHHMIIHAREKPHKCSICGKAFTLKGSMKTHMMIHIGEKPHECKVCGKAFIKKSNMKRHMMIHTGEKPYECNVCGKAFIEKGHMETHIMIHTGEKPYECNVCGKAFVRKADMKHHTMIHTGK